MKFVLKIALFVLLAAANCNAAILIRSPNGQLTSHPTATTLAAAAVAPDLAGKTVVVTSALSAVQSNISSATLHAWPADRELRVEKGGGIANTTAFTINGSFFAGHYQIFYGTGLVKFSNLGTTPVPAEWWGAKGDNLPTSATINTAATNAALQAAKGGTIILPGTGYYFNGPVKISDYTYLKGSGMGTILYHNGDTDFITYDKIASPTGLAYAHVSDFQLVDTISGTRTTGNGVDLQGPGHLIERMRVSGFYDGVKLERTYTSSIKQVRAETALHDGFSLYGNGTSVTWQNTYASYNGRNGYYVQDNNHFLAFLNTASDHNTADGYYLKGTLTALQDAVTFVSPGSENNGAASIRLRNTFGVTITGHLSISSINCIALMGAKKVSIIHPVYAEWSDYAVSATQSPEGQFPDDITIIGPQTSSYGLGFLNDGTKAVAIYDKGGLKVQHGQRNVNMGTVLTLDADSTVYGNVSSTETDLKTFSLPALTLNGDTGTYQNVAQYFGYGVQITAAGFFNATGDNKATALYVGGTKVCEIAAAARNGGSWMIEATIMRSSATNLRVIAKQSGSDTSLTPSKTTYTDVTVSTMASNDVTIKTTGTSAASNLVRQGIWTVQILH